MAHYPRFVSMRSTVRDKSLETISLFQNLPEADIGRLSEQCLWRQYTQGSEILRYLDDGNSVFFVTSGEAQVVIIAESGRGLILRDVAAGDFFGELAAIDPQPRSASIVAKTNCTVGAMPSAVFNRAIDDHKTVRDNVLRHLVVELRTQAGKVLELTTLTVGQRLRLELLRLARPRKSDPGSLIIAPPPNHQDLAHRIGTRREAVTKELSALQVEGLVDKRRGGLVLLSPQRLRAALPGMNPAQP